MRYVVILNTSRGPMVRSIHHTEASAQRAALLLRRVGADVLVKAVKLKESYI